jgi:hypothetical protein
MTLNNIYVVLLAWGIVYLADYYITIYSARLFRGPIREHIRFESSLELTPEFQKDVDTLRWVSPNFLLRWLGSFVLLYLVWWLTTQRLGVPQVFDLVMGGLFLREAVVLLRHLRNLALVRLYPGGLTGTLLYEHWLTLQLSAAELFLFGLLYLICSLLLPSWFFLGGGLFCLLTAWQHWVYARRARSRKSILVLDSKEER